jgi:hypothetical protein
MLGVFVFAAALATAPDQAPAAGALQASPALPAVMPVSHTAASQMGAGDPNRVVCHTEETTGTRLGSTRVCMSAAQWQARANANREVLDSYVNKGMQH